MIKDRIRKILLGIYKLFISSHYLRRARKMCPHDGKIKVGFLVQMTEVWDKLEPVFDAMAADDRFDPAIVVLRPYDYVTDKTLEYGDELEFFLSKYGQERVIRAFDGGLLDLETMHFDYVFYQRCWEGYIPREYRTRELIKYTRTCYIPYGTDGLYEGKEYYSTLFFSNLYMCFSSNEERASFQKAGRHRKVFGFGSPALESFVREIPEETVSRGRTQILWTPRWSEDKKYGGTSFYDYMHDILKLKDLPGDVDLVMRPHPLTFQQAVISGRMTEHDIDAYKEECLARGALFDSNTYVEQTLLDTDILITDFSSIILYYFATGRPVIYCTDTDLPFESIYREMLECMYIANSFSDVERFTGDLLNGIDPLAERRAELAEKIRKANSGVVSSIINAISDDFNNAS